MRSILGLFSKSPFGPTQIHLKKAIECAQQLRPLFNAAFAEDYDQINEVRELINRLEHEADEMKNEIRNDLPKSIFLPVDRRDLLELIHVQDRIADSVQEVAGMLTLKKLSLPEELKPDARQLIDETLVTVDMAGAIGAQLDELAESAFTGLEAEKIIKLIDQLDDVETKSDVIGVQLARKLFALEAEIPPVDLMLWYQIFYTAGQVANNSERMGNRLRLLIARG